MEKALTLSGTTIGQKAIMAVSGLVLFGFVVGHLLGNLQVFLGPEVLNDYAASLHRFPALLWGARLVLSAALLAHIWAAINLTSRNADARPVHYRHKRKDQVTNYAARTMMWSGPIVALYVVYHLLHLTFGYGPEFDPHNVYNNVVHGFRDERIAAVYIVANLLLGMHLFHGAWSWFQSLGLSHARYNGLRRIFASAIALFVTVGNVGIPVAVQAGVLEPTPEEFCYPELAVSDGECEGFAP